MTTMAQTRTVGSHVQASTTGSLRRPALVSRRVAGVRRSVIRRAAEDGQGNTPGLPRPNLNQGTEQTNDVAEPKVDQSKVQNIAPGNISNQNAEKRADIGATRPPTLFGKLTNPVVVVFDSLHSVFLFEADIATLVQRRNLLTDPHPRLSMVA